MDDFAEKLENRRLYSHVRHDEAGMTLADYLARYPRFDAAGWRAAVSTGRVQVNGRTALPETRLAEHDCVAFFPGDLPEPEADLRYRTVYADEFLAVFDKPADLCVHPTGPFFRHTLWHLAGREYGELRFVTRLDRETSGLVVAARDRVTAAKLDARVCPMRKEYLVLVIGDFAEPVRAAGRLVPDSASMVAKKKRFVADGTAGGPEFAETALVPVRKVGPDMTLVRAVLHTGRQHQIRATLCSLGFPVAGDKLYGPDERLFLKIREQSFSAADRELLRMPHQALHAARVCFPHPHTGKMLDFRSEPEWTIPERRENAEKGGFAC